MMSLVGRTLASRYDVLEQLGTGGMGAVYRARDRELDELVALKVIRSDVEDAEAIDRFRNEVKLARRVTHANVARTFELGWADGLMFCTMELVDGESLAELLARERRLPVAHAVAVASALCDALEVAHAAAVIHRDIKPANVLIASDGRVVLADFGIAAASAGDGDTAGTPAYMAPEQARGEPPTPAADVYAVGVLLYEMLTGEPAFPGPLAKITTDKQEIERLVVGRSLVPAELANVVGHATARIPEERVATAAALRRALAPWASAARAVTTPPTHALPALHERTVVVIAPPDDHERLYLVAAVHDELLAALSHAGGIRVLPRSERSSDLRRDIEVRFELAGDELALVAERIDGAVWPATLRVPSDVHSIPRVVALAVRLIEGLLAPAATRDEAYALIAQARQVSRRRSYVDAPYALVDRAHALAPADPVVNANHAILLARAAFFAPDVDSMLIPRATEYVRVALATGGHLADTHIAAGHLELHTGESSVAAAHYRVAIACAPHSAEAHDHLGRMLLEAGYLDAGFARLAQATAISPLFVEAAQAIARAHALEDRWHEVTAFLHDERNRARQIIAARLARWRGDMATVKQLRASYVPPVGLDARIADLMFGDMAGASWSSHRHVLMALLAEHSPSRRRNAFVAQLVAEAAGQAGDVAGCTQALASSAAQGLFDRHWLEKCPLLACARSTEAFATVHAQVAARADAIYDALYGDHRLGHGETVLATS